MITPDIEVLHGLEAVRRRPEMYLASIDAANVADGLLFEALCHAFDEAADARCSQIEIALGGARATIEYDAGLPLCLSGGTISAHVLLATLYACKARKKHLAVGDEVCRTGLAVTNALSAVFDVETISEGQQCQFSYRSGVLVNQPTLVDTAEFARTKIELELDTDLLQPGLAFSLVGLREQVKRARGLLPRMPRVCLNEMQ